MTSPKQTKKREYTSRLSNEKSQSKHEDFRLNNSFFRQILDSLEDYAIFTTNKSGVVSSWNKGSEKILGYKEKEIIGKNADLFFIPEDLKKGEHKKELSKAIREGRALDERWHVKKDGSRFWGSGLVFPLKDEEGNTRGFTKIMRDLTERKKAEENLNKWKLIFQKAGWGAVVANPKTNTLEDVNEEFAKMHGYKAEEMIGMNLVDTFAPESRKDLPKFAELVHKKGHLIYESIHLRKDGTKFPTLTDVTAFRNKKGEVLFRAAFFQDVSDQISTRRKIEESEERLRLAVDAGKIGVWDWNIVTNEIKWSDKIYEIHGLNKKNFDGSFESYNNLIHPEDRERIDSAIKKTLKDHTPYTAEFRIIRPDKSVRWVTTSAHIITDENKKSLRMLGATIDITERKQLEKQKDEFVGIASHELKTPVTSIKAYTQLLMHRFKKANDLKSAEFVSKMDAQLNKLNSLIGDLLDVTKIESGRLQLNPTLFNFKTLTEEIVEEMQRTTQKHKLINKLKKNKKVFGDKDRIAQVLVNLISNAIKYSPHSEKINIITSYTSKDVTVCVEDFGVGISKDKQEKVFERFFRVSGPSQESFPGLGLGLYISSEIIKRQGGKIWVESRMGKGSTFCFTLPLKSKKDQKVTDLPVEELEHE